MAPPTTRCSTAGHTFSTGMMSGDTGGCLKAVFSVRPWTRNPFCLDHVLIFVGCLDVDSLADVAGSNSTDKDM